MNKKEALGFTNQILKVTTINGVEMEDSYLMLPKSLPLNSNAWIRGSFFTPLQLALTPFWMDGLTGGLMNRWTDRISPYSAPIDAAALLLFETLEHQRCRARELLTL